ncbi:MAG: type I secretion system permease/ATPase [Alphaproteobacteria bacterium]|nr:type I secretion system permease/ATPase [Alphaproteobacteria bacterium]
MLDSSQDETQPQEPEKKLRGMAKEAAQEPNDQEYMTHWFWGPVLACRKIYGQVIAASVLINMFALGSSLYIMTVYDRVIPNEAIESLWALTMIMLVIMGFDFAMKIIRGQSVDAAGARIDRVISERLFNRIARHDVDLDQQATGALANTVREFESLKEILGSASFTVFADLPFVVLFLFVLWGIGGPVAAVPALIVIGVVLFGLLLQPVMRRLTLTGMVQGQGKQAVMVEMISALETIKTLSGLSMLRQRWLQSVVNQAVSNRKTKFTSQLTQTVTQLGQQISQVGIVVYGVYLIASGELSMGQLIACVILSGRTLAPLGQLTQLLGRFNQAIAAYRSLGEILSGQTDEEERAGRLSREKLNGDIAFNHVNFTYEGQDNATLNDVSFEIKAGERVAILGRIGSGKTTILRLLAGLHKPDGGLVMIDNADVHHIRPKDLRNNMSIVFQNPVLFSGSIRENLLMGAPDATDADLLDSVRAAGAEDFIGQLPGGFDFPLSERGRELSSGMRQSLVIARALLSKPSLLLLDEPTASLDVGSELALVKSFDTATRGITTVFVTHRGPMLQIADRILVVESGRLVADGPRDEVLKHLQASAQNAAAQDGQTAQAGPTPSALGGDAQNPIGE